MTRLLQISDPHFGTERDQVVEALVRLSAELQPDIVVLSGDLTQRATHAQFERAAQFVDRLAVPCVYALPGNHDIPLFAIWTRLLTPYRRYRRWFGDEGGFVHACDDLLLVGVNSARHLNHKDGELDARQIDSVSKLLGNATPEQLRLVVLHHPVHTIRPQNETDLVRGGERAVRAWADAGADLVLGGHVHLPYLVPMVSRYPDLSRAVWCLQAGTATSSRTRGGVPNSVNTVAVAANRSARVDRYDYEAGTQAFVCVASERCSACG